MKFKCGYGCPEFEAELRYAKTSEGGFGGTQPIICPTCRNFVPTNPNRVNHRGSHSKNNLRSPKR